MPRRLLMTNWLGEDIVAQARNQLPRGFELLVSPWGSAEYTEALAETEFLIGGPRETLDAAFYRAAPKLRLVQLLTAGYDWLDLDAARAARVPICNIGGANATAVAELTILLMLAVARKLPRQHEGVAAGRWRGNDFNASRLYELEDKTLGIVGLGNIGRKVARRARAFGMRILYYDINRLTTDEEDALQARFALFPELLRQSDVVSLHVPLDNSTRDLIGAGQLAMMQPTAILVNTCRGPVVDEKALYEALRGERILGAGLDVLREEPPPLDHPFFTLRNVVLTPHIGGPTAENWPKTFRNAFDNCERVARGQQPLWVVPELRN